MRYDLTSIESCPIIHATQSQFLNFSAFVEHAKELYSSQYGMVKVVPPSSWRPRQNQSLDIFTGLPIKHPIEQCPEGKSGVYEFKHIPMDSISYQKFVDLYQPREATIDGLSSEQIETLFWKTLPYFCPVYGADILASLMDESAGEWNLNQLDSILQKALPDNIKGVNTAYCYIGSWKSLFCWHKQDLDLDAINYLHSGKSKFWYCIHTEDSLILQKQAKKHFFRGFDKCNEFLRHKTSLINPYMVKSNNPKIRISKIQQKPNEFILAFSGAYHCGFNFGINVAEAVNFATMDWLDRIISVKFCKCKRSSVKVDPQSVLDCLLKYPEYQGHPKVQKLEASLRLLRQNEFGQSSNECNKIQTATSLKNLQKTKKIQKSPKKEVKADKKKPRKATPKQTAIFQEIAEKDEKMGVVDVLELKEIGAKGEMGEMEIMGEMGEIEVEDIGHIQEISEMEQLSRLVQFRSQAYHKEEEMVQKLSSDID